MASTSRLYTRLRIPRTNETKKATEIINLVSLDIDKNDLIMDNSDIQLKIYTRDEIDACIDYITSEIKNIYLFLSSDISNTLIPLIYNWEQIELIYILHKNEQYQNSLYSKNKIRNIFYDINKMIKQFQDDITELNDKIYSEKSTFQNINIESAQILWWKIFDKMLQHIQHTNIAKDEIIEFFKEFYPDNEQIFRQIEEFKDSYTSDKAIYWYTRETFLYRVINRILRTKNNLKNIFKIRLFLTDLIRGLKTAQLDIDNIVHYPLTVYRGQQLRLEDIEQCKSNIGNSIFFGNFLSTSKNKDVAQVFAESSSQNPSTPSVLFTMKINSPNTNNDLTPFADISNHSAFQSEVEILVSMHSVFLVESAQLIDDNLWHIQLAFNDNIWDTDFDQRSIFSSHADQIFIRHLSKENKQFIAFQVLLDIILRVDQNEYAKQELIEFARSKYKNDPKLIKQREDHIQLSRLMYVDNPIELEKINGLEQKYRSEYNNNFNYLEKIDDFEKNYQSEDAAKWYTKDSFLYRLLNETLRSEIIDCIVKMRYFINDLHNHLAQLQTSFIQSLNEEKNLILYRGQPMKIDQLNQIKENIGGLISMNSFLSTTKEKRVAFIFSGDGTTENTDEVSVIYEILIDTNIRSTPYAQIETVNPDEEEILFSMGSIFRIEDVDTVPNHNGVYCVKLIMKHIEDELWNKLTAHLD